MIISELCRAYGVGDITFYMWRKRYGRMEKSEIRRLRELEKRTLSWKRPWMNTSSCSLPPKRI